MKAWGPLSKIINNFKMATTEREAEQRVSVSVGALCHRIGHTPLEPALQRGEGPGQPRRLILDYVIKSSAHLSSIFLTTEAISCLLLMLWELYSI